MVQYFITYGCWNKGACKVGSTSNGVSAVITEMDRWVSQLAVKPEFIAIAGDNYYPKIDEATETTPKKKYFNESELKSGFACLRNFQRNHKVPIDIISGNHDTENTLDFEITTSASSRRRSAGVINGESKKKCLITSAEVKMAQSELMTFTMFSCRLFGIGKHTLVLMLDSNIYIENMTKLKDCYLPLLRNTAWHLLRAGAYPAELNVSAFASTIRDAVKEIELMLLSSHNIALFVETLRSIQNAWVNHILETATKLGTIKNVVIVAHHPLAYHKIKKGKVNFETGTDAGGGAEYLKLCRHIYGTFVLGSGQRSDLVVQCFYSCADLHTYQAGTVILANADGATPIRVNQQIAGTGGTTLETEYASSKQPTSSIVVSDVKITYDIAVAIHSHGFLHWTESPDSTLTVNFIQAVKNSREGGGTHRRRRVSPYRFRITARQRQQRQRKYNRNRNITRFRKRMNE